MVRDSSVVFSLALMAEYDLVDPPPLHTNSLLQLRDQIQSAYGWLFVVAFDPHLPSAFLLISPTLINSRSKSIYKPFVSHPTALQCEAGAWCTHAVGKAVGQDWLWSTVVPLSSRPYYVCKGDITYLY